MGITLVIVGGISVVTLICIIGDYFTKTKVARSTIDPQMLRDLAQRIECLEKQTIAQETKISQLEGDISFANKLLEDRTTAKT